MGLIASWLPQRGEVDACEFAEALLHGVEEGALAGGISQVADRRGEGDGDGAGALEGAVVAGLARRCGDGGGFVADAAEGPDALGAAAEFGGGLGVFEGELDGGGGEFEGGVEVVPVADCLDGGACTGAAELGPAGAGAAGEEA